MLRISWRNVIARFGRIILTSLAIIASTAFLSGTFIFRDTIERTFDALFADAFEDVDAYVQSSSTVETAFGFEARDKLPIASVQAVAAVPGVADAQAFVQGDAVVIGKDGEPITQRTAPSYGSTINSGELSVWRIVDGRPPAAADELALDQPTARDQGFVVGDAVKVNSEGGSRTFELVGIAQYDELSSPANATWALFDAVTASEFVAKEGSSTRCSSAAMACSATTSSRTASRASSTPRRSRRPSPAWRSPSRRRRRSRRRSRSSRSFSRCSASSRSVWVAS
jgi:putative ABC transport system permease protein